MGSLVQCNEVDLCKICGHKKLDSITSVRTLKWCKPQRDGNGWYFPYKGYTPSLTINWFLRSSNEEYYWFHQWESSKHYDCLRWYVLYAGGICLHQYCVRPTPLGSSTQHAACLTFVPSSNVLVAYRCTGCDGSRSGDSSQRENTPSKAS